MSYPPSLPVELWRQIAQDIWQDCQHEYDDKRSILGLILVNRMLHNIGLPFLYRHLYLNSLSTRPLRSLKRCARTLLDNDFAASCVRHLSFTPSLESAAIDRAQEGEEEMLDNLVAQALLRTPNLVSLYLRHKTNTTVELTLPSVLLNISPTQLPFRLRFFSTNFSHNPWLADFMESQTSIRAVAWEAPSGSPGPARCLQLSKDRNIDCMAISGLRATDEDISHCLQHIPSPRHLTVEVTNSNEVVIPDHIINNLETLTLGGFGWPTEAVYMILDRLAGLLPSLKYLKVMNRWPTGCMERRLWNLPTLLDSFPALKTVELTEPMDQMLVTSWLASEPKLPLDLQLFINVGSAIMGDQGVPILSLEPTLVQRTSNAFSHQSIKGKPDLQPDSVIQGSRICVDPVNYHDPEKVLNLCALRGTKHKL